MPTVTIDTREFKIAMYRLSSQLNQTQLNRTSTRAINYALRKANTQFKRQSRQQYNVDAGTVNELTNRVPATSSHPEGNISGATRPLSLSRFSPRFETVGGTVTIRSLKTFRRKRVGNGFSDWKAGRTLSQVKTGKGKSASNRKKGVSIEVFKGQRKTISYAFLNSSVKNKGMNGISSQIWARSEKKASEGAFSPRFKRLQKSGNDLPIFALKTTTPFQMLTNDKVMKPVSAGAYDDYNREFLRLATLLIDGKIS